MHMEFLKYKLWNKKPALPLIGYTALPFLGLSLLSYKLRMVITTLLGPDGKKIKETMKIKYKITTTAWQSRSINIISHALIFVK